MKDAKGDVFAEVHKDDAAGTVSKLHQSHFTLYLTIFRYIFSSIFFPHVHARVHVRVWFVVLFIDLFLLTLVTPCVLSYTI